MAADRRRCGCTRHSGVALALVLAAVAPSVAAEAPEPGAEGPRPDDDDGELPGALTLGWGADDHIEVYYTEFLLAQWVLERSPWNAYHSAVAFSNNKTGEKALFDFTPQNTSSVMNMIIPEIVSTGAVSLLGDYDIFWRNAAKMQFFKHWPDKYSNFVYLGRLNGTVFKRFASWVIDSYNPNYREFQPLEVAAQGRGNIVRSRMCHDFVTDSMWALHRDGVKLAPKDSIFRDHIIMYASHVKSVEGEARTAAPLRARRRWLRFLRGVGLYMELIKDQFTHGRAALLTGHKLGLPVFWHTEHADHEIFLVPPFLNYCYISLAIPPKVHDPFTSMKLCALGLEANLANVTAPWPWGPLLATEERLDRPEFPVALVLVALAACLASRS